MTVVSFTTFMFRLSYSLILGFSLLFSEKKFLDGGQIFGCIKSMLNFMEVESDPHKEQC